MTEQEALKVAAILAQADNGCTHCVDHLVKEAQKSFPQFDWRTLTLQFDSFEPYDADPS